MRRWSTTAASCCPDDLYEPWTFEPRAAPTCGVASCCAAPAAGSTSSPSTRPTRTPTSRLMHVMLDAGDRSGVRHQFEMLERVLRDELAAEPGPAAVELLRRPARRRVDRVVAARADARRVAAPARSPRRPRHVRRAGRRSAPRCCEHWALACEGHTVLAVVAGEPGIGKSRLVSEVAREVHDAGGKVLLGACHEDVDQPYGPFSQAIVDDAARLDDDELRRVAGDWRRRACCASRRSWRRGCPARRASGAHPDGSTRAEVLDAIASGSPPARHDHADCCSSSRTCTGRRRRRVTRCAT